MRKNPYMPLYTGDWKKDPQLSRCAPATRGIWIDLLCDMHELDRCGELRGTAEELAVAARCTPEQLVQSLTDLRAKGAADVEQRNKTYVIRNRRMFYESRKRKLAADRQLRYRNKDCNADSNANVSLSESDSDFELFWEAYPRGRKTDKARAREAFCKAAGKAPVATIIAAAAEYAQSARGRGQYVKMPATWLNGECWNDDREAWRDRDADKPEAPAEYRKVERHIFDGHAANKDFLSGPFADPPDAEGRKRIHGTLKGGRKIESTTAPLPAK